MKLPTVQLPFTLTSSLLGSNILNTLFSSTLSLCQLFDKPVTILRFSKQEYRFAWNTYSEQIKCSCEENLPTPSQKVLEEFGILAED
jgi:hypothetical protein